MYCEGAMATREPRPSANGERGSAGKSAPRTTTIPVANIRPEAGLSRRRSRAGHTELCDSIKQFGVLTPITVRRDPTSPEHFLLIKGQGRTLACQVIGLKQIPAIIVDEAFDDEEKVQQFLVENVARLRMTPVERALLIAHSRRPGEETSEVAQRFGVSAATVRRLESQLVDLNTAELRALRNGSLSLAVHAVIARFATEEDRPAMVAMIEDLAPNASSLEVLLTGLGWRHLAAMGPEFQAERLALLRWAIDQFADLPSRMSSRERLRVLAERMVAHPHFAKTGVAV